LLLERRRRDDVRAAAGRARARNGAREAARKSRGDRRRPARHEVPRRTARADRARISVRELRRGLSPAGARAHRLPGARAAERLQSPRGGILEESGACEVVAKFMGGLWASEFAHSPLDVVAWHGDYVPYKYDLARFMAIN